MVSPIIELSNERNPMLYVAFDGSYGDAEGLVVINNESFDEHFYNYLDYLSDWLRPSYAEWFSQNDHSFLRGDRNFECYVCEDYLTQDN